MRSATKIALLCLTAPLLRADYPAGTRLTILVSTETALQKSTAEEMSREAARLLQTTGLAAQLRWRDSVAPGEEFEEVVIFKLRGACRMSDFAAFLDERGPLAWAHTASGEILPFGDVSCDRVRSAVTGALSGAQRALGDALLGRALARVIAHEIYHIMGRTHLHGRSGVARASLSGSDLIAHGLSFAPEDARRIRPRFGGR
jgi:hypothetical protein